MNAVDILKYGQVILVCTDGRAVYPRSIRQVFREKIKETAGLRD